MLLLNDHNGISEDLICKSAGNKMRIEEDYVLPVGEHAASDLGIWLRFGLSLLTRF